ncbi:MAG: DUF1553 domain-containing protein [Planctomycetota bacterium]
MRFLPSNGSIVQPAVPKFMGSLAASQVESRRANRLDLAHWLVDAEHGNGLLTARVTVNRLWSLCFGSGLAGRLDDFAGQGEPPVHRGLLDRLTHAFVKSSWDTRAMMKQIVTSRTYQQSSVVRPELMSVDPNNRLSARQSAYRLSAEMVRDNALAISGLLVQQTGVEPARVLHEVLST